MAWVVPTDDAPVARRAPSDGRREHRALGGPQGARPRRRPAPHGGGQGPAAGARAVSAPERSAGSVPAPVARSSAIAATGEVGALRRAELVRVRHRADADDDAVHDVEHERRHDGVTVHEDRRRLAVEHRRPRARPCTFLATFSRNRELRYGPTTGRMAARTLPPPSVQTTTSSESIDEEPRRGPRWRRPRGSGRSARGRGAGRRRSAGVASSIRLRARAPSWRQAGRATAPASGPTSSNG